MRQLCFFFFKQKTAYEMRISDWSSDVCSSDLPMTDERSTEGIRLQKVLAAAGIGSRRACEALIEAGRVSVNDEPVLEQGRRVDPEAHVISPAGRRAGKECVSRRRSRCAPCPYKKKPHANKHHPHPLPSH